ncbi:GntR family transcriptional regulator [Streptomyces sp. CFMR 7]|uniref:GntR family transcriptional regulator n=1 Tax=Streptomyces sp. CFMR 7 TaxID=1649184 RepID=UPI0011A6D19A|nr:GntR family transcriptional regulator [Streptomyces sp. CFMR 7]
MTPSTTTGAPITPLKPTLQRVAQHLVDGHGAQDIAMRTGMTTPLPERTLLPGPPYGYVRNALHELRVTERAAPEASTAVAPIPAQLTDLADQWVKAAHTCVADMGSATQRAQWQTLISAVETRQGSASPAGTDVLALCTALRNLLRTMLEYSRYEPPVTRISDYLRSRITDGTCSPGSPLGARRIAAELRLAPVSAVRVKLALADLKAEGVVESTRNGIRVTGTPAGRPERSVQVAQWLRTLIREGVYPPGSALPRVADLARPLVTPTPVISSAVALLDDEGAVRSGLGVRAVVVQNPGFAVAAPLDLTTVDRRLTLAGWAGSDTSPQRVRETCRRARSWWHHRITPAPDRVPHTHRTLTSMAAQLIPAAHNHHQTPTAKATMRRAAVTALAPQPEAPQEQLWRTACLAAAVLELQELAGDAA